MIEYRLDFANKYIDDAIELFGKGRYTIAIETSLFLTG